MRDKRKKRDNSKKARDDRQYKHKKKIQSVKHLEKEWKNGSF